MSEGLNDPVLRCVSCAALLTRKAVSTLGCCTKCGMKRVSTVKFLSDTEIEELREKGIDENWLAEFSQEVPDV